MPRRIDERKKRKALRKLRKAAERARAEDGTGLSDWEEAFIEEVETRIETYGSAFADPGKGRLDEPLSARQAMKLKEIDRKSRGRAGLRRGKGFKRKSISSETYRRDIYADLDGDTETESGTDAEPAPETPITPPALRLIRGGRSD